MLPYSLNSGFLFQMQCRNISCFQSGYLSEMDCIINETMAEQFCHAVFLQLTPFYPKVPVSVLQTPVFMVMLQDAVAFVISFFEETAEQIGIFIEDGAVDQEGYVSSFVLYFLLNTQVYGETNLLAEISDMIVGLTSLGVNTHRMYYNISLDLSVYGFPDFSVGETGRFSSSDELSFDGLNKININQVESVTCKHKVIVPFTHIKICPFIIIGVDELDTEIQNDFLIINEVKANLSKWEYEIHAGNIYLCLDDYEKINKQLYTREFIRDLGIPTVVDTRDILAFVFVCLSLLCLIVTIITYSYFTQLQSQPGVNNLILCVFLFFAQSMYQFGAGQSSLSKWACSLVGALCHFMWLAAIFSMNVCSVHIYLTFSKNRKLSSTYNCKQTTIYIAYIIIASLVFIVTNIIVSLARSHGQEVGYGGKLCYLSSSLMQVVTFLIPLAILLISNILLFAIVVFKIYRISAATSKVKKEKSYLLVYARLSSLTGITWIVGFLQFVFNHEVFEYLFIIFNASQGIFIMIAFVLNKRVRSLFSRKKTFVRKTTGTENVDQSSRTTGTDNVDQSSMKLD